MNIDMCMKIYSRTRRKRKKGAKKRGYHLDLSVSSLRRGHANLLCIVPILTDARFPGSNILPSYFIIKL